MNVLVIGANGQIGNRLVHQLKDTGHNSVAMVRKEEQIKQFKEHGVDTVLADLEKDFSHAYQGVDAVVFSAGSGGDTPKSQTKVIDRDGAIKAIDEAEESGVKRFIMVSALKANRDPGTWSEPMEHYYDAKAKADEHLRNSDLSYTVLMPGRLTNESGTGKVELKERIEAIETKTITRDDVASVIVELLDEEQSFGKSLELLQGETSIKQAISDLS
ncbi:SDR family oxidoreductase [Gracilimonas sediminicola]|uniref:SDR family oxidoreductase n=1 Tax=Gracilimonas sediminicola TaxID=2952158 RepID=A0A9X2L3Z3_9BACT|nr:SDR family oxidoreductase [Gracilimonas sediminicola]MCP9291945.1 SDR family oxidoreductase [Gracilimonas sediminicola]